MSAQVCSRCGQRFTSELPGGVCSACAATTAIATPEDAATAKVTPPETAVREGEPALDLPKRSVREHCRDAPSPSGPDKWRRAHRPKSRLTWGNNLWVYV
jgi:hypothetical protein